MANETIELLKNYEPKKMQFPAYFGEKLDGVPVRIYGSVAQPFALTRQGEEVIGIDHIIEAARPMLKAGASITGELYIKDVPFKDLSGMVRNHRDEPSLVLHVFDANLNPGHDQTYDRRWQDFKQALWEQEVLNIGTTMLPIRPIFMITVNDAAQAEHEFDFLMQVAPKAEGAVLHSKAKLFQPGKRCWGTQRMKPQPTIDLQVESYEEATDALGNGKKMVGRINVFYERQTAGPRDTVITTKNVIGIGPGALSHEDRRMLWREQELSAAAPGIIEVKYMPDPTYDALRQPTFVRFRPDKETADVHVC